MPTLTSKLTQKHEDKLKKQAAEKREEEIREKRRKKNAAKKKAREVHASCGHLKFYNSC